VHNIKYIFHGEYIFNKGENERKTPNIQLNKIILKYGNNDV